MFYEHFSVHFWLESGKICKSYNHTPLFHCINTGRVARGCLNTWPSILVFKQLSQDQVNAYKNVCGPNINL